jgi:hypothetical protein
VKPPAVSEESPAVAADPPTPDLCAIGADASLAEMEVGAAEGPSPEEIQLPVMENLDRTVTGLITAVPPLLVVLAGWLMWDRGLHWRDIAIFAVMYVPVGLGITVGFHRLLTHRSFKTSPWMRGLTIASTTRTPIGSAIRIARTSAMAAV